MENKVKEMVREYMKRYFKKCRINSVEWVNDYICGMDTVHVFKLDVSLTGFLDTKHRINVFADYNFKGFLNKVDWQLD